MQRPIDADALEYHDVWKESWLSNEGCYAQAVFKDEIDEQPTIDAEPVKHGKWIDIDEQTYTWKIRCSCCGNERSMLSTQGKYPNYCEACGARMDAE